MAKKLTVKDTVRRISYGVGISVRTQGRARTMATKEYRGYRLSNRGGGKADWFVSDGRGRVRWGSLAEVRADVDALIQYGRFPPKAWTTWA